MRKTELSYLNILFCMLVIFIHIISYPLSGYGLGNLPYNITLFLWRLSSFVVQGFVLTAGIKMFLGKEKPYLKMLFSKLKNIILPYAFWYVCYFVFYMVFFNYPFDILFILKHFFLGSLTPHTYFVPLIMQFFILYPLWKLMVKKINPAVAIIMSVIISLCAENILPVVLYNKGISFMYNDRLFTTYLSYWVVGCFIGANYEGFKALLSKVKLYIPFILISALNLYLSYLNYNGIKIITYLNVVHSAYCFITILMLFSVFLKHQSLNCRLLKTIDNSSYTIYLCHMLFVFVAEGLFSKLLCIQSNLLLFILMAVFTYPLTIFTSYTVKRLQAR